MAKVDHDKNVRKGHTVSVYAVAKALGTRPWWVEQCMVTYGRRLPKRPEAESGESAREDRVEHAEGEEPEEVMPEDIEEPSEGEPEPEKAPKRIRPTPGVEEEY